jgi:hypothetical protein
MRRLFRGDESAPHPDMGNSVNPTTYLDAVDGRPEGDSSWLEAVTDVFEDGRVAPGSSASLTFEVGRLRRRDGDTDAGTAAAAPRDGMDWLTSSLEEPGDSLMTLDWMKAMSPQQSKTLSKPMRRVTHGKSRRARRGRRLQPPPAEATAASFSKTDRRNSSSSVMWPWETPQAVPVVRVARGNLKCINPASFHAIFVPSLLHPITLMNR